MDLTASDALAGAVVLIMILGPMAAAAFGISEDRREAAIVQPLNQTPGQAGGMAPMEQAPARQ